MTTIYRIALSKPNPLPNPNKIKDLLQIHPYVGRFALYENDLTLKMKEGNETNLDALLNTLQSELEMECKVLETIEEKIKAKQKHTHDKEKHEHDNKPKPFYHLGHWGKGLFGVILGAGLLLFSILNITLPFFVIALILVATTLATLYLGYEMYIKSIKKFLQTKKLNMNLLYTISTVTIIVVSIISLFVPGLPLLLEGPLILGLWHIGKQVEHSLKKKVDVGVKMKDCAPKKINCLNAAGEEEETAVKKIIPNEIIVVHGGEVIPLDGICLENNKDLLTTRVTGSPYPKTYNQGDKIKAGMSVPKGESVRIKVTKTWRHSYLSLLDERIKNAKEEKAPIQLFTDKILQFFIPGILVIALISGLITGIFFTPILGVLIAIGLLTGVCPCALGFIIPNSVRVGMEKASKLGIIVKNGKELQAAGNIDIVVLDLNGTLTTGKPEVTEYEIIDKNFSEEQFFQFVAMLEEQSDHPIAKAIVHYAAKKNSDLQVTVPTNIVRRHSGIRAVIDGRVFMIGNENYLNVQGITVPSNCKRFELSNSTIYVAAEGKVIGKIGVSDSIRPDAPQFISELKKLGKDVHICTGADKKTADCYGRRLGIPEENIASNCVGEIEDEGEVTKTTYLERLGKGLEVSKTSYIKFLQGEGKKKVTMIGDAPNDVGAVVGSDFSVAIDSGLEGEITQQEAGAVVKNESLMSILALFKGALLTKNNIVQNLIVSLSYNTLITLLAIGLLIFLGITIPPALGVLLAILETSIVVINTIVFSKQSWTGKTIPPLTDELEKNPAPSIQSSFEVKKPSFEVYLPKLVDTVGNNPMNLNSDPQKDFLEQNNIRSPSPTANYV